MNYVENREVRGRQVSAFEILEFTATLSPASVGANTVAAEAATFTGLLVGDIPLSVVKPTEQAGLGIAGLRVSAVDTCQILFANPTAGAIVPTASELYTLTVRRTFTEGAGPGLS
jgi:hypothetical protein